MKSLALKTNTGKVSENDSGDRNTPECIGGDISKVSNEDELRDSKNSKLSYHQNRDSHDGSQISAVHERTFSLSNYFKNCFTNDKEIDN